jgi:hypothetical protein
MLASDNPYRTNDVVALPELCNRGVAIQSGIRLEEWNMAKVVDI